MMERAVDGISLQNDRGKAAKMTITSRRVLRTLVEVARVY
jgi:hypothetical protein